MIVRPFFPNWESPYVERFAFLTEILTSDAGREQRRAYRDLPRQSFEYRALVSRDRARALRRSLMNQGEQILMPNERLRATIAAASLGASEVSFSGGRPAWAATGRQIVLEDRVTRQRQAHEVDTMSSGGVTLVTPLARPWAESTRVMPGLVGTLDPSMRASHVSDQVTQITVGFDVEPGFEMPFADAAPTMFAGREVLDHKPNWSEPITIEYSDPTTYLDYQVGRRTAYRPINFGTDMMRSLHLVRDEAELNATLGVFMRAKGRRGEFYVPSGLSDFTIETPIAAGGSVWRVPGHDFHDAYNDDTVHRAFAVYRYGQPPAYFEVTGMAKAGTTSPHTLVVTQQTAPANISPADVQRISWMPVCRFIGDEISVSWVTDRVAEIRMNYQTTETLP